jgi:CRP-like cAMP-binding protein
MNQSKITGKKDAKRKLYRVVFKGKTAPDVSLEVVKEKLASLFNTSVEKIEKLFRGKEYTIYEHHDYRRCKKVKQILTDLGAICHIKQSEKTVLDAALKSKQSLSASKEAYDTESDKVLPSEKNIRQEIPVFQISRNKQCPLYQLGDIFQLEKKVWKLPETKPVCLILVRDVLNFSESHIKKPKYDEFDNRIISFECSGCSGRVGLTMKDAKETASDQDQTEKEEYFNFLSNLLCNYGLFKSIETRNINKFVSSLRLDRFGAGEYVIKKGDSGKNLFIIVSGAIEVLGDDEVTITTMGEGEVFGEMSILSGDPVGATIRSLEPTSVLYISDKNFREIINRSQSLQTYFTRLLARRMSEINTIRSDAFKSGLTGKLSEIPPGELFQTLNINRKTGVLTLKLFQDSAYMSFRDGELVNVRFNELEGEEAFFELLKLKRGRFKFKSGLSPDEKRSRKMGDFMEYLMEGIRRIEEADRQFLRTMIPNLKE